MQKIVLLFFVSVFLVTGCAASDRRISPMLNAMTKINQAVSAFGPPNNVSRMPNGDAVYVWETNYSYTGGGYAVHRPTTQTYSGTIYSGTGRQVGTYEGQSYGEQMTYTPTYQVNMNCVLKIMATSAGNITTWSYRGNACDQLIINPNAVDTSAPVQTAVPQITHSECLRIETIKAKAISRELDEVTSIADAECRRILGKSDRPLANHFAKQTLGLE